MFYNQNDFIHQIELMTVNQAQKLKKNLIRNFGVEYYYFI